MSIENNDQYSMDMVMATLAGEDGDNSQQTTQHTTPTRHVHHPNTSSNTTARANTTDSTDRTITTTDRTITTTAGASNATDRTGNDYGQEKGSPPQVRRERIKEHSKATSIDSGCVSGTMSSLRLGNDGADDDDDLMDTLFSVDDTAVLSHTHASTNKRGLDYCDKGLDDPPRTGTYSLCAYYTCSNIINPSTLFVLQTFIHLFLKRTSWIVAASSQPLHLLLKRFCFRNPYLPDVPCCSTSRCFLSLILLDTHK